MKTRISYFDFLRIFAALAVVMLHVSSSQYNLVGIYHYSSCLWDGFVRWGVPIFVMISGALFLEPTKTITIKNVFKKYIPNIVFIFIIWSLFYTLISCFLKNNFSFVFIIKHLIAGYYHQWFLFMIAGLYLITPLLRPITEKKDKNLLLYLLIIWFVMASIVPFTKFIVPQTENIFDLMINKKLNFSFPLSFVGYFILGYYLHNYVNIKKQFMLITVLIISFSFTILGDIHYSIPHKPSFFLKSFSPFVIITAISLFLLIKNKYSQIKQSSKVILKLSDLTLGVYMIHPFFIKIAEKTNIFNIINSILNDYNFFTILIVFVVISFCSFTSIYILSKIQFIKKWCL